MDGLDLMAGAMQLAQRRLDTAAHNLANASSEGFHRRVVRARLDRNGFHLAANDEAGGGAAKFTGRPFDLAVAGHGNLVVRGVDGRLVAAQTGAFERALDGRLVDAAGRVLMSEHGPVRVPDGARIDDRGAVLVDGAEVARLALPPGTRVQSGFLALADVDAIHEMVDVMSAQRAFETAEKTLVALDDARSKDVNDVARIKQ